VIAEESTGVKQIRYRSVGLLKSIHVCSLYHGKHVEYPWNNMLFSG